MILRLNLVPRKTLLLYHEAEGVCGLVVCLQKYLNHVHFL